MAKTIKKIADELGVSKTAVRKKIANLGLQSSLQKNGNQFVIDEEQEKIIKSAFSQKESQTENANKACEESETLSVVCSLLREQLEAKDKQIESLQRQNEALTESLKSVTESLHASQLLQANAEKKLLEKADEEVAVSEEVVKAKKHWWNFMK